MGSFSFSFNSMGCLWTIRIWDSIAQMQSRALQSQILKMTNDFDNKYSRFIQNSLIFSQLRNPGVYNVPKDLVKMLTLYQDLYKKTDKKFTPLIGQLLSDLGYDHLYSLQRKKKLSPVPDFLETVMILDEKTIKITQPILFDIGALGKGYWVDQIASFLQSNGFKTYLVDGSGDLFFKSEKSVALKIGLEDPTNPKKVIGKLELKNKSLCGSGVNRRSWRGMHHIIDPSILESTDLMLASWVIADSATYADALATCLFLVSPEKLIKHYEFEYLILKKDMSVVYSQGFNAELFF